MQRDYIPTLVRTTLSNKITQLGAGLRNLLCPLGRELAEVIYLCLARDPDQRITASQLHAQSSRMVQLYDQHNQRHYCDDPRVFDDGGRDQGNQQLDAPYHNMYPMPPNPHTPANIRIRRRLYPPRVPVQVGLTVHEDQTIQLEWGDDIPDNLSTPHPRGGLRWDRAFPNQFQDGDRAGVVAPQFGQASWVEHPDTIARQ